MPKVKVLSAEKAFEAAHYGGPFDFNKEDYIIISITDIRNEEDCPVIFRPIKNLKAVFRVPFIDLATDKLDPNISIKEQTGLDLPVFSEKEALKIKQIGDFAKEHGYHILVHCEAGVSRSQAVGACLELYVNNDTSNIERRIHSGNYTYFQTFFQQFDNEWNVLGDLQEPSTQTRCIRSRISTVTYVGIDGQNQPCTIDKIEPEPRSGSFSIPTNLIKGEIT